jgi:membrane-associated protease RseP (regulator of RpoE activity)
MAGDDRLVNGSAMRLTNETQLMHAMRGRLDELHIEVERDGKRLTLAGRVEPEPNVLDRTGLYVAGMLLSEVDRRLTREVDVAGMWVEFVAKGSAAETAEVMAGTILVSVNGIPAPNLKVARMALQAAAESGKPAVLVFKRAAYSAYSSGLFHWMERQVPIGAIKSVRVGEAD